jgi:ABC-type cobalt transport system substrate-binding protein
MPPKAKVDCNDDLEKLFPQYKAETEASKEGARTLDPEYKPAFSPEWSKKSIKYLLYQEHCEFPATIMTCCLGSRHLRDTEMDCQPLKGDAPTLARAAEDTRSLTLGCRDLHIEDSCQICDGTAGNKTKTTQCNPVPRNPIGPMQMSRPDANENSHRRAARTVSSGWPTSKHISLQASSRLPVIKSASRRWQVVVRRSEFDNQD